jgi:hypothetical protein
MLCQLQLCEQKLEMACFQQWDFKYQFLDAPCMIVRELIAVISTLLLPDFLLQPTTEK